MKFHSNFATNLLILSKPLLRISFLKCIPCTALHCTALICLQRSSDLDFVCSCPLWLSLRACTYFHDFDPLICHRNRSLCCLLVMSNAPFYDHFTQNDKNLNTIAFQYLLIWFVQYLFPLFFQYLVFCGTWDKQGLPSFLPSIILL